MYIENGSHFGVAEKAGRQRPFLLKLGKQVTQTMPACHTHHVSDHALHFHIICYQEDEI